MIKLNILDILFFIFRYLHGNELKEFQAGTFSNLPSLDRL